MALEFRPPTELINAALNRPSPGQEASNAILGGFQAYAQQKALKQQQQQAALKQYIDAFSAGGPDLAGQVGKLTGLQNAPTLPGAITSPGGIPPTAPPQNNFDVSASTPTEVAAQQSMPSEHPSDAPTAPISPLVQASLAAGHPNHSGITLPGNPDPLALAGMGKYGKDQLGTLESVQKLTDAQAAAKDKAEENGPKSFDYARAFSKNAGSPQAADEFIKIAQGEGRNTLTKREMADLKDSINVSAQQGRGQYYANQAQLNQDKFTNELLQQGNKGINPNAAASPLKPQQDRLNRIGRASALIDQMKSQSGSGDTRQMRELATSLASVLTGGNVVAQGQIDELVPQTYKGNAMKFFEKLSNNPTGLEQQAFVERLADTLNREKGTINTQIQGAQDQAQAAMQMLKKRNPQAYKKLIDANVTAPTYQNPQQQSTGPHGPSVTQNGLTYTWNGTNYE